MRRAADKGGPNAVTNITSAIDGLTLSNPKQQHTISKNGNDVDPTGNANADSKESKPATNGKSKARRNRKKNKNTLNTPPGTNNINNDTASLAGGDGDHDHDSDSMAIPVITSVTSLAPAPTTHNSNGNPKSKSKNKNQNQNQNNGTNPSSYVTSGNNILLVSNEDYLQHNEPHSVPPSFLDNSATTGFSSESPEEILGLDSENSFKFKGKVPPEEILGLDLETEYDEDDSTLRAASWCLANQSFNVNKGKESSSGPSASSGYSYQAASAFHIGPMESKNQNSGSGSGDASFGGNNNVNINASGNISKVKTVRSPGSVGSSASGDTYVPPFAYCSTFLDELLSNCQAWNCSALASIKCAQCLSAKYCNEDHQKADWTRHKEFCTPYRVVPCGDGAADGLPVLAPVAIRNVPEGQVIFEEKPMLVFPLADSTSESQFEHVLDLGCVGGKGRSQGEVVCKATKPACLGCMRVVEVVGPPRYQCNNCKLPLCSYNCQFLVAHQAGECEPVRSQIAKRDSEAAPAYCLHTLYMDVEILRALQLEVINHLEWEKLLEMKNNVRVDAYKATPRFKFFTQHSKALVPFSAKFSGYNLDLIADVHAIISSLSFRPTLQTSFKLLFNTQPLFAHDCVPNTLQYIKDEHTGDQNRMKLVTKAASAIIEGEMITIDFSPSPYLSYPRRKKILKDHLSIINCLCQRCQNPRKLGDFTSEVKCTNCRVGTIYPESPPLWEDSVWSCSQCQEEVPYHQVEDIEKECGREIANIVTKSRGIGTVSTLLGLIDRRGKLDLNPQHHLIIMCWCFVEANLRSRLKAIRRPDPTCVYSQEALNEFRILGQCVELTEKHMDAIRPGIWIDRGILFFSKFYSSFVQLSREHQDRKISRTEFTQRLPRCMKLLIKSLEILSVYEGYNAPLVSQLTQEVTSSLADIKKYYEYLITKRPNENQSLPSFKSIGIGE